jgi:hypothetical protein
MVHGTKCMKFLSFVALVYCEDDRLMPLILCLSPLLWWTLPVPTPLMAWDSRQLPQLSVGNCIKLAKIAVARSHSLA